MRILTITLALLIIACGKKTADTGTTADSTSAEATKTVMSVCVFEGISLRSEPSQKGKWIAGIALGEKLTYLNEVVHDSVGKLDYAKVRLSDGTEGWASAAFVIPNARPAAVISSSFFYKRPDLSTVTDKAFEPLDFVAVTTEEGEWMRVTGKRRKNSYIEEGWLNRGAVSFNEIDVAVASMTAKAMASSDASKRKGELDKILKNSAVSGSQLVGEVRNLLADMGSFATNTKRVVVDRAYFYDSPNDNAKTGAYVVRGDAVTVAESSGGFIRASFNAGGTVTDGWIKASELE